MLKAKGIDDLVMNAAQIRHIKHITQGKGQRSLLRHVEIGIRQHCKMQRNWRTGYPNRDLNIMVFDQQGDLLCQVIGK